MNLYEIFWKYLNIFLSFFYNLKEMFLEYWNSFLSFFRIQNQKEILSLNKLDETPLNVDFLKNGLNNTSEEISKDYISNINFWIIIIICLSGGLYLLYYFLINNTIFEIDNPLEKPLEKPIYTNLKEIVKSSLNKNRTAYEEIEIKSLHIKKITLEDQCTIGCYDEQMTFFNQIYLKEIWPAFKQLDPSTTLEQESTIWNESAHFWFEEISQVDGFSLFCQILYEVINL